MRKVCHLTSAHQRYDVRIFEKECVSLAKNGYSVTLIVNDNLPNEQKYGVNIVSTGCIPKNRIDRMINSTKLIYKKAIKINADIYHFHDPELLPVGKRLKKQGKKVIFDAHEDTECQILDKSWIPGFLLGLVARSYAIYSKNIMKQLDAVITVTPHLVEKFCKYNKTTIMVTNYPIVTENQVNSDDIEIKSEPYVCFAGGISEQWMHDIIVKAIEKTDGIRYILAGCSTNSYIKKLIELEGWKKVDYIGKIPHADVKRIYAGALAGMAVNYCSQIKETGSLGNTKLFEYMEAGIPVICSNYPLWKDIVVKNNCGICVDPRSSKEIQQAIEYLFHNPKKVIEMGKNGRRAIERYYNWEKEHLKLIKLYERM